MKYVACIVLMFFAVSCSSSRELSRSKAQDMLQHAIPPAQGFVLDADIGFPCAVREKLLVVQRRDAGMHGIVFDVSAGPASRNVFWKESTYSGTYNPNGNNFGFDRDRIYGAFKKAVQRTVEVTGITDAGPVPSAKVVQYSAAIKNIPDANAQELQCYLPGLLKKTPHEAVFRLYDDGWRIENLGFNDENLAFDNHSTGTVAPKNIETAEAVKQGVIKDIGAKVDLQNMDVSVDRVSFLGQEAQATVSMRPKGSDKSQSITMNYSLERQGDEWRIKNRR